MFIYQTDSFVFRDDLDYWCSKNYDFIGAPWFKGWGNSTRESPIIGVGNGGFSLRKIKNVLDGLHKVNFNDLHKYINGKKNLLKFILLQPFYFMLSLFGENICYYNSSILFEDRLICEVIPRKMKKFKVSPIVDAIKFSFEANPRELYKINNNQLPMGCHAWWLYEPDFWKNHIENLGYKL